VARYLIVRVLSSVALLVAVSFVIFSFLYLAPGNPLAVLLGGHLVPQSVVQQIRAEYHLNDSFLTQFAIWFGNILHGNFGESIASQAPVWQVIRPRILPTLELAAYAFVLVIIFGFGAGMVAAIKQGRAADHVISGGMLVAASLAQYVSAIFLIVIFAVKLRWFPVYGLGGSDVASRLYHLTLPAIALALSLSAFVGRTTRTAMSESLLLDHVDTARSAGLSNRSVIGRHALRSALVPIVTVGGLTVGYLITGAVLVEYTFGLNGLGYTLISAIENKDFAVVQAIALIFTFVFILANLVSDLLYMAIDPRIRLSTMRRGK
jgi:peptide/nickel transport system permease protein